MLHHYIPPYNIPVPTVTTDEFLRQAVDDIITILTTPSKDIDPQLQVGNTTKNALLQVAKILKTADKLPNAVPSIVPSIVPASSKVISPQKLPFLLVPDIQQSPRVTPVQVVPRVQSTELSPKLNKTWKRSDDSPILSHYNLQNRNKGSYCH